MATLRFVRREPDKGYYGRQLWLPKSLVNSRSIKRGLEFPVMDADGIKYIQLWLETDTHLIIPREYLPADQYDRLPFPIIDVGPEQFPRVEFRSRVVLDKLEPHKRQQRDAFRAMLRSRGGLLNLACGRGKTVLALHHIAARKVPALVVVNNTTLIDQWQERIAEYLDVPGGVGVVQGPPDEWDWEGRGIVVGMIHTLANYWDRLPLGFDRYFGAVYYDEVHHLSAPYFVKTAPLFFGERHGLTATTTREDGLETIYQYHIGQIYYRDLSQDLKPAIYFQMCPVQVNMRDRDVLHEVTDKKGKLSIPKLRGYLGKLPENNDFIAEKLHKSLAAGRKILALSHSVAQLRQLHSMFGNSGLCTGAERPADRIRTLREKQISFGTLQLVREALDEATLDTLFFLTPFGRSDIDDGGANTLQQGMGRILRVRKDKKLPIVVIFDHIFVPKFHKMCTTLKRRLSQWPKDQGGPLEFTTVRPYQEGSK